MLLNCTDRQVDVKVSEEYKSHSHRSFHISLSRLHPSTALCDSHVRSFQQWLPRTALHACKRRSLNTIHGNFALSAHRVIPGHFVVLAVDLESSCSEIKDALLVMEVVFRTRLAGIVAVQEAQYVRKAQYVYARRTVNIWIPLSGSWGSSEQGVHVI